MIPLSFVKQTVTNKGPSIKCVTLRLWEWPGKRYGGLRGCACGGGVAWRSLRSLLKQFFCSGFWVTFQLNSSGTGIRTLPCIIEVCNGVRKVCKLSEYRWGVQASVTKLDTGLGVSKKIKK